MSANTTFTSTQDCLRVLDTRTNLTYEIPIQDNIINSSDLAKITENPESRTGRLCVYDPGFENTAAVRSEITYVADDKEKGGILEFRGHAFTSLAWNQDFEDVMYLMIWGHLPTESEKLAVRTKLAEACMNIPPQVPAVIRAFPKESHYYPMLMAGLAAWNSADSSLIPAAKAKNIYHNNVEALDAGCIRTIAAYYCILGLVHCHRSDIEFTPITSNKDTMMVNLFRMMGMVEPETGRPSAPLLKTMNHMWIAGMDNEMNNSTAAMLHAASSLSDPISCFTSAVASCYGILHFGAAESGYRGIQKIGKPENVRAAIAACKATNQRIMGIGHRVYKSGDPRTKPMKQILRDLEAEGIKDPLLETAYEVERQVSIDPHYKSRGLVPNVDLYWFFAYTAFNVPLDAILPIFLASRVVGMMAHWREAMLQPIKIYRPTQVFTGERADDDLDSIEEIKNSYKVDIENIRKATLRDKFLVSILQRKSVAKMLQRRK